MISLKNISKHFGHTKAVQNISFDAKKGEIIGFLGPNGAGKTTTMRMILGLLHPSSGQVKVNGLNPVDNRLKIVSSIGYLPENNPLYLDMKVKEYLSMVAGVKKVTSEEEVVSIVKDVALESKYNSKIEELSRGYRQRVGLASALLSDPSILILDEPTSGLDPIEQDKIKTLINKISKNKIIIFSTHILSEVEDISNRLIIINNGEMVFDGDKPKLKGGVEKLFKKLVK
jgi:ABC-2 type transport system ATP-binding protein